MKLLLLKVLIVTVLTVDSRLFPDEPEGKTLIENAPTAHNERKRSNNGSYPLNLTPLHTIPRMKTLTVHLPSNISKSTDEESDYVMESNPKMHHYKYIMSIAKAKTNKTIYTKMVKGNAFENNKFNTDANASRPLYSMKMKGTGRSASSWRADARCGPRYLAPNGEPGTCQNWCCSASGWCGGSAAHCDCDSCTDYRVPWRDDARCGPHYLTRNGEIGTCPNWCCSASGWCGGSAAHCDCDSCTDYRGSWRDDARCGPRYLAPNGEPGTCQNWCCSASGWCGGSAAHCDCDSCTDYRGSLYRGYVVQFAPKLRFDSKFGKDDYCFPSSANDYYFARIGGNTGRICNRDYNTITSGNVPTYWKATPCGEDLVIAFWLWYGFQSGCLPGGYSGGVHDGDWEHIYVKINKFKTAPTLGNVQFYQHKGWYTRKPGSYEREGLHPIVYIGKVAHGSYHQDGGWGGCGYWEDFRKPGSQNMHMNTWLNLKELKKDASSPAFMNNVIPKVTTSPLDRGETYNMCSLKGCSGWGSEGCYHTQIGSGENF